MASRAGSSGAPDPAEVRLQAAVQQNPDDIEARLSLARLYAARSDWMAVWNESTSVLERAPGNPHALAYQGLVRLATGQANAALELLQKALAADPNQADAYGFLALAYAATGRMKEAEAAIATAAKRFPDRAADFEGLLARLKTRVSDRQPTAARDPGARPPGTGERVASGKAGGRRVSGTVELDPSLAGAVDAQAVLFVFVRKAGATSGPPIAVKRLPAVFPAAFELSEADSMMGQAFPDPLLVEARLDSDGDPTTRPPSDPRARLDGLKAGRSDVRLVLRRSSPDAKDP
jgi:tetratricopeptide (TPR) repeat protein